MVLEIQDCIICNLQTGSVNYTILVKIKFFGQISQKAVKIGILTKIQHYESIFPLTLAKNALLNLVCKIHTTNRWQNDTSKFYHVLVILVYFQSINVKRQKNENLKINIMVFRSLFEDLIMSS